MYKGAGNNGMTIVDRLMPVGQVAEEYAHYNYRATKEVYHMDGKAPNFIGPCKVVTESQRLLVIHLKVVVIVNRRLDAMEYVKIIKWIYH